MHSIFSPLKGLTTPRLFTHAFFHRFFELEILGYDATGKPAVNRTSLGSNATYNLIYTDVLYYVLCFALPLISLAFMNWRVIIGYRAARRRRRRILTSVSSTIVNTGR